MWNSAVVPLTNSQPSSCAILTKPSHNKQQNAHIEGHRGRGLRVLLEVKVLTPAGSLTLFPLCSSAGRGWSQLLS